MKTLSEPATGRRSGKARTREKLLQAAIDILIEDGYAGFSMNKVAKGAGIAQPSFYTHFENTEQLLEGLADEVLNRYLPPIQLAVHGMVLNLSPTEARALIHRLFLLAFNVVKSQEKLVQMIWSEREQRTSPFGERLRTLYNQIKLSWSQVLLDIGLVPVGPDYQLRLAIFMDSTFALFETYAGSWLDGRYADPAPLVDALADYVMNYWENEIATFFGNSALKKNLPENS